MNSIWMISLLYLFPKRLYTRCLGRFVHWPISAKLIPWYIRHFRIDTMDLAKDVTEYLSLGEFFTRSLHPTARPVTSHGIVSPVDGRVSALGQITDGTLLQVKNQHFPLARLLGDAKATDVDAFDGGQYVTLYLSPKDYHRIHAPMPCRATRVVHVPGTLFPVNDLAVHHIHGLFHKNERTITYFDAESGPFALVKVGAAGVGTVRLRYAASPSQRSKRVTSTDCSIEFEKGQELGFFQLGSTVVLLFSKRHPVSFTVAEGQSVRMGEQIAVEQGGLNLRF